VIDINLKARLGVSYVSHACSVLDVKGQINGREEKDTRDEKDGQGSNAEEGSIAVLSSDLASTHFRL
jgi:hypothetical protein